MEALVAQATLLEQRSSMFALNPRAIECYLHWFVYERFRHAMNDKHIEDLVGIIQLRPLFRSFESCLHVRFLSFYIHKRRGSSPSRSVELTTKMKRDSSHIL